jgi:hypothetical protein
MLLPANCLKILVSQLANSFNISWGLVIQDYGDGELSPHLTLECIPPERQKEISPSTKGQLDLE